MSEVTIAGEGVADPLDRLHRYAERLKKTVIQYDLAAQEDAYRLTSADVQRTRRLASRISNQELAWFLQRAESATWSDVPADADLRNADPSQTNGLYDRMDDLYVHFRATAPRRIRGAKISKVLHLKRPALFPILDSHLERTYRKTARHAAQRHPERGHRYMYWAAIRDDLLGNSEAIAKLKEACAADDGADVRRLTELTDLRVMDILTW